MYLVSSNMKVLIFILCTGFCSCVKRDTFRRPWTLSSDNEILSGTIDGTVPGGVFSDLMSSGLIEDIFYGFGDADYKSVGLSNWTYSTTFEVDEVFLRYENINLVFDGVDTFATILVNGRAIGSTRNMFLQYIFNVKEFLVIGTNTIEVELESSVAVAAELAELQNADYPILPSCFIDDVNCNVNQIRKMQSSYGWDWGPSFASLGIWKNVSFEAFDTDVIRYVTTDTRFKEFEDVWTLSVTTYFDSGADQQTIGFVNFVLEGEDSFIVNNTFRVEQHLNEYYETLLTVAIEIPKNGVSKWWPNGYGNQTLYPLIITYTSGDEIDTRIVRVGFRTVELVQDELENGLTFYFKVNGIPIFAKGSNEIPLSILPEKGQDPALIKRTLRVARDTNMNMLRIWGGGVYESDYFYDLADEYGILIWQDFMFAVALYPSRPEFLENVREEVSHQLKRLGNHPSIAVWSGNNENEAALSVLQLLFPDLEYLIEVYKSDYIKLYVDTIKAEFNRVAKYAIYVSSSPSNGLETIDEGYIASDPLSNFYGDVHFYNYVDDSWNASTFPVTRFTSEFGYQSFPSVESWLTATNSSEDLNPFSEFVDHRQHHENGTAEIADFIDMQLSLPNSSNSDIYAKAFIYYSQIIQAQSIKVETEYLRSYKGRENADGSGYSMGALYWQLNDVWVAPTWSGLEYMGRWKMLQYFSKKFFAPTIVTINERAVGLVEVYIVTDQLLDVPWRDGNVSVMIHVFAWNSFEPLRTTHIAVTPNFSEAVEVMTFDPRIYLEESGCGAEPLAHCFLHFHLLDNLMVELGPQNYYFPEKIKHSNLVDANLLVTIGQVIDEERKFLITVTADAVALFVWLDSHEILGTFSDNGFLQVTDTQMVIFTSEEVISVQDLANVLTVTHLRDPQYRILE